MLLNQITSNTTLSNSDFTRYFDQFKEPSSVKFQSEKISETAFIFLIINKMDPIFEGTQY